MNDETIGKLIDKLANDTKVSKIKWYRANSFDDVDNNILSRYLTNPEKDLSILGPTYLPGDSYYALFKTGYIIFIGKCSLIREFYILSVQGNSDAKVSPLNEENSYQSELIRLKYLIEEQISDVDQFIDSILSS